jgi:hypothetical protein
VDSAFLHGMKKMFNTADDIKELIDPYVNFSFAGQQVRDLMNIFIFAFVFIRFHQKLFIHLHIRNSIKNFDWDLK